MAEGEAERRGETGTSRPPETAELSPEATGLNWLMRFSISSESDPRLVVVEVSILAGAELDGCDGWDSRSNKAERRRVVESMARGCRGMKSRQAREL